MTTNHKHAKIENIITQNKIDTIIQSILKETTMDNHKIWETPIYSKRQINNAGKTLSNPDISDSERTEALSILNNWRASHAYPLQVIYNNLRCNNPNAIVVQRLKRLDSIVNKIQRFPNMQLYKMQDLGGCRVIVDTIDDVYRTVNKYQKSRIRHKLKRNYDYINEPKTSGYRCYHMVYQYHSDKNEKYNNMLIEIQVRTKLQHIWATAVEMMGIYTKSNLKASQGDEDTLRFFTLISSLFAIEEGTPICPNTSSDVNILLQEINELDRKNHIIDILSALNVSIYNVNQKDNKSDYYILILNYKEKYVRINSFSKSKIGIATKLYDMLERNATDDENIVLVSATSFNALKNAYPNYFVDIHTFIETLNKYKTI